MRLSSASTLSVYYKRKQPIRHFHHDSVLALYVRQKRCGLTLKNLGNFTGMKSPAVCQSALRVKRRLEKDEELKNDFNRVLELLEGQNSG